MAGAGASQPAEYAWLRVAGRVGAGGGTGAVRYDDGLGGFVMAYLADGRQWKAALLAGAAAEPVAVAVADVLGRIHAAGLRRSSTGAVRQCADFHALRVEPYLLFTATRMRGWQRGCAPWPRGWTGRQSRWSMAM